MRRRRRLQETRTVAAAETTTRATRPCSAIGAFRKREQPSTAFLPSCGLVLAHSVPNQRLVLLEASPADDALELARRKRNALYEDGHRAARSV